MSRPRGCKQGREPGPEPSNTGNQAGAWGGSRAPERGAAPGPRCPGSSLALPLGPWTVAYLPELSFFIYKPAK